MKKLITILSLAIASFVAACSPSDSPSYDYSSVEACEKSMIAQGEKEGFSEKETEAIFEKYMQKISSEKKEEVAELAKDRTLKSKEDFEALGLEMAKKYLGSKTIKELKEYADKE